MLMIAEQPTAIATRGSGCSDRLIVIPAASVKFLESEPNQTIPTSTAHHVADAKRMQVTPEGGVRAISSAWDGRRELWMAAKIQE